MFNMLMVQEAISSTEIEIGRFTEVQKAAIILLAGSGGDLSYKDALAIAEEIVKPDPRPFDTYLNGMTIEEKIMGAVQEVIDNFKTTYDRQSYSYEPSGYWKPVNDVYVYQSSTPAQPFMLGR